MFTENYSFVSRHSVVTCQAQSGLDEILIGLSKSGCGTLVVLLSRTVVGTITHGDLLKYAINFGSVPTTASQVMNTQPKTLDKNRLESDEPLSEFESVKLIPILDEREELAGALKVSPSREQSPAVCPVLISAGGRGIRLGALTDETPKPLVNVGGVPILERQIISLQKYGFTEIFISVCYLGQKIMEYFGDGSKWGCNITYLEEDEPLGNAGSLRLLPESTSRVLLMNADLLTHANFCDLLQAHTASEKSATMLTSEISVSSEFGEVESDSEGILTSLIEKPSRTIEVNAGVYIFELSELRSLLPSGAFSAVDAIGILRSQDRQIQTFSSSEIWLDIGRPSDLERANRAFSLISPFDERA